MTTLLKNGLVLNVFTGELERANVLIDGGIVAGVGDYEQADTVEDVGGRVICPAFIDGHIHIESTMLRPAELAKVCVPHGTCAIVADPHEIANVSGVAGISYMMEAAKVEAMNVFFMLPSCVPATPLDESGAHLRAQDLEPLYDKNNVLGLAEMMNFPGVLYGDPDVLAKIDRAKKRGRIVNGHAPMLTGKDLDRYIAAGVQDDHECSSLAEAQERVRKGQWVMIREGTSARNLENLIGMFDEPYCHRCLLVTDDKHPYDLLHNGHIDAIILKAVKLGKSAITGIQLATIRAAECFRLSGMGAVAPGYEADLLVLDDLDTVDVRDVYYKGKPVCRDHRMLPMAEPEIAPAVSEPVYHSFRIKQLTAEDFRVKREGDVCRVIRAIPGELITEEKIEKLDFSQNDGVSVERDVIKLAVCERHLATGHIGLGFIEGLGLRRGAIASSVSHDSHNLIITGTNEADMALAGNTVAEMGGGLCVAENGKVLATLPLPIAGLMSDKDASTIAEENRAVREAVGTLGVTAGIEPFMNLAFVSLPVIPALKMTTQGLVDVNRQARVPLFVK